MEQFGELLFDAVNDALRQVFGEYTSKLVFNFVERSASSKREAVDEKIEALYGYLERLIGSKGARIIQAASLKFLCVKLWQEYLEVEKHFSVLDELYEIKFKLLASFLKEEDSMCN